MRKQIFALAGGLLVVGVLTSVSPVAAAKTAVDVWSVMCVETPGETWTLDGETFYMRGMTVRGAWYVYDAVAEEVVFVGSRAVVTNADINLATGELHAFGLGSVVYFQAPGSASGTYDGIHDGFLNIYSGEELGYVLSAEGTNDLLHQRMRLEDADEETPDWLSTYLAENPPPCADPNIMNLQGSINHPN